MFLTALLIIFISVASFVKNLNAEGKSFTSSGNFKIETADQPLIVNGVSPHTYLITCENSAMCVTIAIDKDKKCRRYMTINDKLSVQYVCNGTFFGVEKLNKKYEKEGLKTSSSAINRSACFRQKALTRGENDPVYCKKLIGAYLPELFNEAENKTSSR